MEKVSKSKSACNHSGENQKDQGWKTDRPVVQPNSKILKTPQNKKNRTCKKGKKLVSLIGQGKMSANEYEKIIKILNSTPDIRSEKVLSFRKALLQGQYQIKNQAIAEKLLKELIFELN